MPAWGHWHAEHPCDEDHRGLRKRRRWIDDHPSSWLDIPWNRKALSATLAHEH
jgi:hypothetical protein